MKYFIPLALFFIGLSTAFAQETPADSDTKLLNSITYTMPQSAIDAEIDGTLIVGLRVDQSGKPTKAWIVSGVMWPCGKTPSKPLEDLSSTISDAMLKASFSPAIKDGKPIAKDIGFKIKLKNPKIEPPAIETDILTGNPKSSLVTGGVLNGKALSLPKPGYPYAARQNRDGGAVAVQVLIDEQGKVTRASPLNGAATLQLAARDAACGAKFSPTLLKGNPVKVSGVITYNFVP